MNKYKTNILLVEDNPFEAKLVLRNLEKHQMTHGLQHCTNGKDALDFIYARGVYGDRRFSDLPGIILLDLNLPIIDGCDVLDQLKSNDLTKNIPIVILVSCDHDPGIEGARKLGSNGFLVKPIEYENLKSVLYNLGLQWMMDSCRARCS